MPIERAAFSTRRFVRTMIMLAGALVLTGSIPLGHAQDSVEDRLDRLERDMNQIQRQTMNGTPEGAAAPTPDSGTQALNTQMRLDALDNQMRQLNGQLEELQFGITQMKDRLDKLEKDDELRFQALEHPGSHPTLPNAGDASPGDANPPPSPDGGGFLVPPSDAVPSGKPHAAVTPPASGDSSDNAAAPAALPPGSAQQQYTYAFNLLRQSKYDAADQAFRAFIQAHPKDPLAGNAQYWIGDIFFVHKQYDKAAPLFAEGYSKYPHSPKAADNLLKLGVSLGKIGHKPEGCAAFARLERDYPTASSAIKNSERLEKKRLRC